MDKKNNYACTICSNTLECYVFDEFLTPFSVCKLCYIDMDDIFRKNSIIKKECNLCDTAKECFKIPLSNNPIKNEIMICKECANLINQKMREHEQ